MHILDLTPRALTGNFKKMMKNINNRAFKKFIIIGMAETAWDNYNASDTEISVAQVESLMSKLRGKGRNYTEKQFKTIPRLVERLNQAKFYVNNSLLRLIKIGKINKYDINSDEKELVLYHNEVQKATDRDALRKSCDINMRELQALLDDQASVTEKRQRRHVFRCLEQQHCDDILDKNLSILSSLHLTNLFSIFVAVVKFSFVICS